MIWEFFLAFLTFIQIPSEDSPPDPVQFNPIQEHQIHHHLYSSDEIGDTMLFKSKTPGPQTPQERAIADKALHRAHKGGDMVFPLKKKQVNPLAFMNAWSDTRDRWPGYPGRGKIPYVIDKSINKKDHALIKRAMEQYNKLTCVKFSLRKWEKDYLHIFNGKDDGCWSYVGKIGGRQELSLGYGCEYIGTIVHELGHALGFLHEHQRHDRDNYLAIYEGNITAGLEDQFERTDPRDEIIHNNFDYNSIMIYGNYAFSVDRDKRMTMEALNGVPLIEPYDKPGLDNSDIERVNAMYECH